MTPRETTVNSAYFQAGNIDRRGRLGWRWLAAIVVSAGTALSAAAQGPAQEPAPHGQGVAPARAAGGRAAGGLAVLVGCEDAAAAERVARHGSLTGEAPIAPIPRTAEAVVAPTPFLVHALVLDRGRVAPIRADLHKRGLSGRVSAIHWDGGRLPYADGSVNLLLVSAPAAGPGAASAAGLGEREIRRVLAPLGTARVERGGTSTTLRGAWPDDIDQWTHARYDATGNPASRDAQVGPPRHLQWYAGPRWNHGVKTSCMVSAGGRVFYILDDSPFGSSQPNWALTARDAFSGVRLWRRELSGWGGAWGARRSVPSRCTAS